MFYMSICVYTLYMYIEKKTNKFNGGKFTQTIRLISLILSCPIILIIIIELQNLWDLKLIDQLINWLIDWLIYIIYNEMRNTYSCNSLISLT